MLSDLKPDVTQTVEPIDKWDGLVWKNPLTNEYRIWIANLELWRPIREAPFPSDPFKLAVAVSGADPESGDVTSTALMLTFSGELGALVLNQGFTYRKFGSAVSDAIKAYVLGGDINNTSMMDTVSFANGTIKVKDTGLGAFTRSGGVSSKTRGYFLGCASTPTVRGVNFNDETVFILNASMLTSRGGGAYFNSAERGYTAGGMSNTMTPLLTVESLTFASDSVNIVSSARLKTPFQLSGSFNSREFGYAVGGNSFGLRHNVIDKLSFYNETYAAGIVALARAVTAPVSFNSREDGFTFSGYGGAQPSVAEALRFAADDTLSVKEISGNTYSVYGAATADSTDNNGFIHS